MTTPRIEEWESVTWNVLSSVQTGRMSLADAQDKLDAVLHHQLQKAHQAGIDEAVEIIKEELRNAPLEVQMTKGFFFGGVIKALQDNK